MNQAYKSEKGMTLIEVLAALAILSFLAIGILQSIQFLTKEEPRTNNIEKATLLGQEHLQYITNNPTTASNEYPQQIDTFTVSYFMSNSREVNNDSVLPKDSIVVHGYLRSSSINDKKLVSVVVSWER